jgi:hypothetical protein
LNLSGGVPGDDRSNVPRTHRPNGDAACADLSGANLFALLWDGLADVLGTAATAALTRRAASVAASRCPELAAFVVVRETLDYSYTRPAAWNEPGGSTPVALRELARELRTLLIEMTGTVVVRHLARIPELRQRGVVFLAEEEDP